jgi:hypothetical protein
VLCNNVENERLYPLYAHKQTLLNLRVTFEGLRATFSNLRATFSTLRFTSNTLRVMLGKKIH